MKSPIMFLKKASIWGLITPFIFSGCLTVTSENKVQLTNEEVQNDLQKIASVMTTFSLLEKSNSGNTNLKKKSAIVDSVDIDQVPRDSSSDLYKTKVSCEFISMGIEVCNDIDAGTGFGVIDTTYYFYENTNNLQNINNSAEFYDILDKSYSMDQTFNYKDEMYKSRFEISSTIVVSPTLETTIEGNSYQSSIEIATGNGWVNYYNDDLFINISRVQMSSTDSTMSITYEMSFMNDKYFCILSANINNYEDQPTIISADMTIADGMIVGTFQLSDDGHVKIFDKDGKLIKNT
jgi:hypothetical protein